MMKICQKCEYSADCLNMPGKNLTLAGRGANAKPLEVMIEVEPRCNFNCLFCFNRYSFAHQGRNIKSLANEEIKKIIDNIAALGVKVVRFTGGEPLLRSDLFQLMSYAKRKKLEVRLNTNGSLVSRRNAAIIGKLADNILIPVESWIDRKESALTGCKGALLKKLTAILLLRRAGVRILRVGTVATRENIDNFPKLAALILKLPINEWEFYRPVSNGRKNGLSRFDLAKLVEAVCNYQPRTKIKMTIANAVPFCAIDNMPDLCRVSAGALFEDGHSRMVIDPRGFIKPHYFIDKKLAISPDIKKAWQHPFMVKMRKLEFLPRLCQNCAFKEKCRGGSRFKAKISFGRWRSFDPLGRA